jgi:hypothetical protein
VYHPVLVSTQNRSRTFYQTPNSEVSTGKSREYSGSNRYRQRLPQYNASSSATKRKDGGMGLHKIKKLLHNKEMVSKLKRPPKSGRKYLPAMYQRTDNQSYTRNSKNETLPKSMNQLRNGQLN